MLSVVMLSVIMLSVVMLNVIMLSVIMLSVVMLSVIMLSVVMQSVLAPPGPPISPNNELNKLTILCTRSLQIFYSKCSQISS